MQHPRPNSVVCLPSIFAIFDSPIHRLQAIYFHFHSPLTTACRLITSAGSRSIDCVENWNSKQQPPPSQSPSHPPPFQCTCTWSIQPSSVTPSNPSCSFATCTRLGGGFLFYFCPSLTGWTNCFSWSLPIVGAAQLPQSNMPPRRQPSSSVAANDEAQQKSTPIAKLLHDHEFADTFQGEVSRLNIPSSLNVHVLVPLWELATSPANCM